MGRIRRDRPDGSLDSDKVLLDALMANAADSIYFKDLSGRIVHASQAMIRSLGLETLDEIVGKSDADLYGEEFGKERLAEDLHLMETGEAIVGAVESRVLEDGTKHWWSTTKAPVYDEERQIVGLVGITREITDLMRALEDSELRYSRMAENIGDGLTILEQDQVVYVNERVCEIFGYPREQFVHLSSLELAAPEERERLQGIMEQARQAGVPPAEIEFWAVGPDGTRRYVRNRYSVSQQAGQVARRYVVTTDITDRKLAEVELQRLARAVEATHDAVVITDLEGDIQFVNPAFVEITGYSRGEALGRNPRILKSGRQSAKLYAEMWKAITSGEVWQGEVTNRRKDGTLYEAQLTISPVRNANGDLEQFVAIQRDITAQKRTEEALVESYERRAEQVRAASEVAQELAAVPALEELFRRVVTVVKERFGYYHVQVFRYQPATNTAVLVAGYGDIGERMLADGHSIPIGQGVVGTAAATGRAVLAADAAQSAEWTPNPNLPGTKGELAVPIMLRGQVLGVLDVQSDRAGSLGDEDLLLLESICGPVALAVEDTNLRQEMEARLRELNTLQRIMTRQEWETFRTQGELVDGFVFDQRAVRPTTLSTIAQGSSSHQAISVPMDVSGEVIGMLGIYEDPDHPLLAEDRQLLRDISRQVTEALQRAQLLEQTQSRASRERVIRDIADQMQRATDLESLLRITAEELVKALRASRAYVRLGTEEELARGDGR